MSSLWIPWEFLSWRWRESTCFIQVCDSKYTGYIIKVSPNYNIGSKRLCGPRIVAPMISSNLCPLSHSSVYPVSWASCYLSAVNNFVLTTVVGLLWAHESKHTVVLKENLPVWPIFQTSLLYMLQSTFQTKRNKTKQKAKTKQNFLSKE